MALSNFEREQYLKDAAEVRHLATHCPANFIHWMHGTCVEYKEAANAALRFLKQNREDPGKLRVHLMALRGIASKTK